MLLNNLNEFGDRSRSHGIPKEVLIQQAQACGLPIEFSSTTWENYEVNFIEKLRSIKNSFEITHAVYGDIDIDSHRIWEEKVSNKAGLQAVLPLWQQDRLELVNQMIGTGIKALIVSCQKNLANELLGKVIDHSLLPIFNKLGIDACGENGEYHTLVVDGSLHKTDLKVSFEGFSTHGNYAFLNFD